MLESNLQDVYEKSKLKLDNNIKISNDLIYHYTSAAGLDGILKNKIMWFTNLKFLNDSSEDNYIYNLIKEFSGELSYNHYDKNFYDLLIDIAKQCSKQKVYNVVFNNQKQVTRFNKDYYIASFSLDNDVLELWRNYIKSGNGVGYNLAVKPLNFIKGFHTAKHSYGKIIYDKDVQAKVLVDILSDFNQLYIENKLEIENIKNIQPNSPFIQFFDKLIESLEYLNIFFKDKRFSNENEYRYVFYDIPQVVEDINPNSTEIIASCNRCKLKKRCCMQYCCFNCKKNNVILYKRKFKNFVPTVKSRIDRDFFKPYIEVPINIDYLVKIGISPNENNELIKSGIETYITQTKLLKVHVWASNIPLRN